MDETTVGTVAAYASHAASYAKMTASYNDYPQVERIMARFESSLVRRSVVVDVGCGAGRECRYFASRGHSVIGVDLCVPLLSTWQRAMGNMTPVAADMRQLPLRDAAAQALVATSSIVHLPQSDLAPTFHEFGRILAAGAFLLVTFPVVDATGWRTRESLPAPRWFSRLEEPDVRRELEDSGFVDVVSEPSGDEWISIVARRRIHL